MSYPIFRSRKFVVWLAILIIVIHIFFLFFNLYDSIPWLDILMHFLGGMWAGFFSYLILINGINFNFSGIKFLIILVSASAFIGVLWEFLEFIMTRLTSIPMQGTLQDTMGDLLMDIIGGIVSWILLELSSNKRL